MPTLSIRVDNETKTKIEKATEAEGKKAYADFLREIIIADLVLRNEDGTKTQEEKRITTSSHVLQVDDVCNTPEYKQLLVELNLKNEVIKAKEAHIIDLQAQVGFQMRQLALPSIGETGRAITEKKGWGRILGHRKRKKV